MAIQSLEEYLREKYLRKLMDMLRLLRVEDRTILLYEVTQSLIREENKSQLIEGSAVED